MNRITLNRKKREKLREEGQSKKTYMIRIMRKKGSGIEEEEEEEETALMRAPMAETENSQLLIHIEIVNCNLIRFFSHYLVINSCKFRIPILTIIIFL